MIPYLVFGIALLVLFKALDKVLVALTGTYIDVGLHAVIVGHVVVALPYTILTILPLLERLSVHAGGGGARPRRRARGTRSGG